MRYESMTDMSLAQLWKRFVNVSEASPAKRTFLHWHAAGSKYAALAAGGAYNQHFYSFLIIHIADVIQVLCTCCSL